jgi:hypothetical protein
MGGEGLPHASYSVRFERSRETQALRYPLLDMLEANGRC